jgi:FAD/FMN-containing dehydrogenase
MNAVSVDVANRIATVGAGASLGSVYKQIAAAGLAFAGGNCPTVGISGHVLGGGYGYLARQFGLACDSLVSLDLISALGREVRADPQTNPELFWASRGGGGGSFGAVTSFRLQLYPLTKVLVFRMDWDVTIEQGARIMKDWQAWAPTAPSSITALLAMSQQRPKGLSLHCIGQSTGSLSELRREFKTLSASPQIQFMDYLSAINQEAGADGWEYISKRMKGKSDYVIEPMSDDGIITLMTRLSEIPNIMVICDPYGGAISDVQPNESAFAHRAGTLFGMQYVTDWSDPKDENARMQNIRMLYAAMRPYVSGSAYVNYCDLDLKNWAQAYWGQNLQRLKQIKASWDPDDVFHHSQSVPVG